MLPFSKKMSFLSAQTLIRILGTSSLAKSFFFVLINQFFYGLSIGAKIKALAPLVQEIALVFSSFYWFFMTLTLT